MLVLKNNNGAWVEEFDSLKELKRYILENDLDMNNYYIVDRC